MRRLTRINWLAALVLLVISISANADDWITHYYENPTPERFVAEVHALSQSGHLADGNRAPLIAAFLGRVMANNPSQIGGWLNQLGGLKDEDRVTLLWAANLSQSKEALDYIQRQPDGNKFQKKIDIRTIELNDAFILDMLWGDFFATGEAMPIRRIVYALNYDKYLGALERFKSSKQTTMDRDEAIREGIFDAACWSLESNVKQHHRVAEIIEGIFWEGKISHSEQLWLSQILAKGLPDKYELTQVKAGEWAFKRK